jgi:hypothetical protein
MRRSTYQAIADHHRPMTIKEQSKVAKTRRPIRVAIEQAPKKAFARAVDWPGWIRSGKTPEAALESLAGYAGRYAPVAARAGEDFPSEVPVLEADETVAGDAGTEFGVPGKITDADRRPVSAAEADRMARLVEAAWATFDAVAKAAPAELRKGPRGGGRDTAEIVEHVFGAEQGYAKGMGIGVKPFETTDRARLNELRAEILELLRRPSDGSPFPGAGRGAPEKRWTARYAAHRIAWHVLDHAWEIEDRSAS